MCFARFHHTSDRHFVEIVAPSVTRSMIADLLRAEREGVQAEPYALENILKELSEDLQRRELRFLTSTPSSTMKQ